jgi:hypothetical protein
LLCSPADLSVAKYALRVGGACTIVPLHDGWYPDELGGGVAVWGNGRYWEVRSSPFDVIASG